MSKDKDLGIGQILGRNGIIPKQREAKKVTEKTVRSCFRGPFAEL